ncbi:cation:proton antiporter [Paenibacillus silviterrae]|uniref:cation:proton antiporter n=1 Tax=Paenibacillus silviterrae TaxID=3242194 RepID=UPI0025427C26|nr:sodium:proton antiporter [Paenibacillus chinjuensis]
MENQLLIHHVLFLLIFILGIGMVSGRLAALLRLPDVALFLIAGMIVGQGLHLIHEASSSFTNQFILTVGSALILFDGGRNIRFKGLRKVWVTITLLSIPGVLITCAVVAFAAHYLLDLPFSYAVLLGAIISSTDPATLIPVFKQVKIRTKVRETVESESAFNDATGSILTFTVLAMITSGQEVSLLSSVERFGMTALGGIGVGILVGLALAFITGHMKLGWLRDYATIALVVTALGTYWLGESLQVSGFMATFVAGLIWGNAPSFGLDLNDKLKEMEHFTENMTVLMRMLIFILLGSQVNLEIILLYLGPSLLVIAIFMLVARPLTVLACTLPDSRADWKPNEIAFMFWVRETGVIPAALCGMVAGMGVKYADIISSVTFMAVLLTIIVQAGTTGLVAKWLRLEER